MLLAAILCLIFGFSCLGFALLEIRDCQGKAGLRSLFVDEIGPHLRRYSLQILALLLALQPMWAGLDAELKGGLPHWLVLSVNGALAAAGIIGGLLKQNLKPSAFGLPDPDSGQHVGKDDHHEG